MPAPVVETFPELGLAHLRLDNRQGLKLKPTSVYIVSVVLSSHLISVVPVYTAVKFVKLTFSPKRRCLRAWYYKLHNARYCYTYSIFYWSFDNNRNNSFMSFSISSVSEYSDAFAFKKLLSIDDTIHVADNE